MAYRLLQIRDATGARQLLAMDDAGAARRLAGVATSYELAQAALTERVSLGAAIAQRLTGTTVEVAAAAQAGVLLAPIDHPDSAHLYVTGTGLTHLGSAESRDKMHKSAASGQLTDSMRIFREGLEGGKPQAGQTGAQPEWFYKGDGSSLIGTGATIPSPEFALDGSEEPEIAVIYLIDAHGRPWRLGCCLGNEFSDHVTERHNYLWLAHSKLRPAALGPELLTGPVPLDVRGTSRILRAGRTLWEKPFLTGESNMSHALANLEHHHFKYAQFRRPGDVHVHFLGTATLSFMDGIETRVDDVFEIEAAPFRLPLRNRLGRTAAPQPGVTAL